MMAAVRFYRLPGREMQRLRGDIQRRAKKNKLTRTEKGTLAMLSVMHSTIKTIKTKYKQAPVDPLFTAVVFVTCQNLKKKRIRIPLPYGWFKHGPTIHWPTVKQMCEKVGYGVDYRLNPEFDVMY